jgi:hypothetical protein
MLTAPSAECCHLALALLSERKVLWCYDADLALLYYVLYLI